MTLTGLADTRRKRRALGFKTVAGAVDILRGGLAATAASDEGAINLWKDRHGRYRAERFRYCVTQSGGTFGSLREVAAWLKDELPLIER